jgi:hypothetical protein
VTWTVDGTGADVSFALAFNGVWEFRGHGAQSCWPSGGGDISIVDIVRSIRMDWSIKGGKLTEVDASPAKSELWNEYQKDTTRSRAGISYYPPEDREKAFLIATVLLGTDVSPIVYDMCKVLLTNQNLQYRLKFDFLGLPKRSASHEILSLNEFTHPDFLTRRPYITSDISLILDHSLSLGK